MAHFGPRIEAVVTHGVHGLSAAEMDLMPKLSIVACIGAGFEQVDLAAARARGIALSYGPHTNASTTADHAVALLLGIVRDLGALDRRLRQGGWKHPSDDPPALSSHRLGLAGDPTVHHIANASVLQALGPQGFLVNIGRGNLVDTAALTTALKERRIAGAALDVFEDEPQVPPELLSLDNVLLTPHLGGRSPQAREAVATLLAQNPEAHFAGRPLPTPIPN